MPFRVLMVCTGNTCRSPLAEGILKASLPAGSRDRVDVSSAGTAALDGAQATSMAREVAARHGIDLSGHRSAALSRAEVGSADLILAMAREHADAVRSLAPEASGRTFLLSAFAGGTRCDVPDPIGGTRDEYETIFETLRGHLEAALPRILALEKEAAR